MRKIKIDIQKSKEVQKLLLKVKNTFEAKRVNIIVAYLKWAWYEEIRDNNINLVANNVEIIR